MPKKNWLEWAVFALSLAVSLGALGALAYAALTNGEGPPRIAVELGSPAREGDGFVVPVTLRNSGDTTAAAVEVEVTLVRGGQEVEQGSFTADFVPRDSVAKGWVTFRQDPGSGELSAAVRGYEEP